MPKTNQTYLLPYDFRGWRARLGINKMQAAVALGLSESTYWRMEKIGIGSQMAVWACWGIETHKQMVAQQLAQGGAGG